MFDPAGKYCWGSFDPLTPRFSLPCASSSTVVTREVADHFRGRFVLSRRCSSTHPSSQTDDWWLRSVNATASDQSRLHCSARASTSGLRSVYSSRNACTSSLHRTLLLK